MGFGSVRGLSRFTPDEIAEMGFDILWTAFEGYRNLRNSSNPLLSGRAERMKEYVRNAVPALYPVMLFGPNRDRRTDAKELLREIRQETGVLSMKERLFCLATIPLSGWTWLTAKLDILQQPKILRITRPAAPVFRPERNTMDLKLTSPVTFPGSGSACPICSCAVESEDPK
jgi:hypothetical protein